MLGEGIPLNLSSERTNASEEICKKFGWNFEKTRTTIQKALRIVIKERKLNPLDYGIGKKIPRFNTDLDAQITPEPQTGAVDQTPQPKTTGAPVGQVAVDQVQLQPIIFDEKAVSATLNAFFLMFRLGYPDLELLTTEEKDAMGRMWLPAFNKYLTEKWAIIGVPLLATAGIFLPKIIKARKIKKEKETEKKEQDQSKQQKNSEKKTSSNQFKSKGGRVWNDKTKTWEEK